MQNPAIEIVVTNVGKHDITDRTTDAGRRWGEAFASGAKNIPGVAHAIYGVSYRDPSTVMHFIGK